MVTRTRPRTRLIPRWLSHLFGFAERDAVDVALADLAKQGAGMAQIAHACATLLVILFSAGSLVALGSDALNAILLQWQHSHSLDVPDTISVCVSTLMVLAMDVGMMYAASMLRVLSTRRAGWSERWLHIAVMAIVSLLESATYCYMSFRFEHPATAAAAALIIARSLAAPLLAVYLSMARALPITSRDILAQAELASGGGVLRDVTNAANDRDAPLARKMRLYGASAVMTEGDRARLDNMIAAVVEETPKSLDENMTVNRAPAYGLLTPPQGALQPVPTGEAENVPVASSEDDPQPPTGGGTPIASKGVRTGRSTASTRPAVLRLTPVPEWSEEGERTAAQGRMNGAKNGPRQRSTRGTNGRGVRTPKGSTKKAVNYEAQARFAWDAGATSVEKMRRATGMSKNAAAGWVRSLKSERDTRAELTNLTDATESSGQLAQ